MLGGMLASDPGFPSPDYPAYVRGGAQGAPYFEWGGYSADNASAYHFDDMRPDWGVDTEHPDGTTVRQLFMETGVSAYFHGHDHQYVYETRDGMAYVEVPSCGSMGAFNTYGAAGSYYTDVLGRFDVVAKSTSANGSHMLITVGSDHATVQLISSGGAVTDTETIQPNLVGPTHQLTMGVSPAGGGTTNPSGTVATASRRQRG